jgi:hypothetical protein
VREQGRRQQIKMLVATTSQKQRELKASSRMDLAHDRIKTLLRGDTPGDIATEVRHVRYY